MSDEDEFGLQAHGDAPIFDGFDEFGLCADRVRLIEIGPRRTAEAENVEHEQRMIAAEKVDVLDPHAARTAKVVNEHDGNSVGR